MSILYFFFFFLHINIIFHFFPLRVTFPPFDWFTPLRPLLLPQHVNMKCINIHYNTRQQSLKRIVFIYYYIIIISFFSLRSVLGTPSHDSYIPTWRTLWEFYFLFNPISESVHRRCRRGYGNGFMAGLQKRIAAIRIGKLAKARM